MGAEYWKFKHRDLQHMYAHKTIVGMDTVSHGYSDIGVHMYAHRLSQDGHSTLRLHRYSDIGVHMYVPRLPLDDPRMDIVFWVFMDTLT